MTPQEIYDLCYDLHHCSDDFLEGDIEERIFKADHYELTTVCPQLIDLEWSIDEDLVDRYSQINPQTCPPVVILKYSDDLYSVIDGTHRIAAFQKLGITVIKAYIGKVK